MFYAHIVLAKKGPLARIWLAAHWDKKLTKAHVVETNIEKSVDGILEPKVKLALRTSGHLLLGVVRIYSRKAKYLLADCNEAFVKIKMAFRSGVVDLPESHREANVNAITLPEVFHDFDTALPELNDVDIEAQFTVNQSRADEITMREDYGALSMSLHDDGFGDMAGFDNDNNVDMHRLDSTIDHNLFDDDDIGGDLGVGIDSTREPMPGTSKDMLADSLGDPHMDEDGFGDDFGQTAAGLFEGDIFGETTLAPPTEEPIIPPGNAYGSDDDDDDHFDTGAPSPMASSVGSRPPSVLGQEERPNIQLDKIASPAMLMEVDSTNEHLHEPEKELGPEPVHEEVPAALSTEEESFALATLQKGITKHKRKRKLIVDEVKNISGEEMKSQLANTADIVTTLDLAPPTKRLMYWKETGGVDKLFSLPSRFLPVKGLFSSYQRNLNSRSSVLEDFANVGPTDLLALGDIQAELHDSPNKRGRKRKLPPPIQEQAALLQPEQLQYQQEQQPHLQPQQLQFDQMSFSENAIRDVPLQEQSALNLPASINATQDTLNQPSMHEHSMQLNGNDTLMPPPPLMNEGTPMHHVQTPGHDHTFMSQPSANFDDILRCDSSNLGGFTPMTPSGLPNIPMTPGALNLQDDFMSGGQNSGIMAQLNDDDYHQDHLDHHDHHDQVNTSGEHEFNDYDEYPVPEALPGDEQQENETDEQFEERVLNKRAQQMFTSIKSKMHDRETLWLSEMTTRNNKKQAAQKFYALLVLKKFRAIEIHQTEAYADISVRRGDLFDDPKL